MATNKGLRPSNCVGVVDSDYRGEIIVALHNDKDTKQTFANGERVAQIVFLPYLAVEFTEVDELNNTMRAGGGFGSTGEMYIDGETGTELIGQTPGQMSLFER